MYIFTYYTVTSSRHHGVGTHHGNKKSYSKREAKLKKEKKNNISPLCPLSCKLGHKRTSTLQRLHITVATHNCSISSRSGGSSPGYTPCIPLHKPPPFTLSCTILLACLTSKPPLFKHSFTVSIHIFCSLPTERPPAHSPTYSWQPYHSPSFINPFIKPLLHSAQLPYPCIWDSIQPPNT